ncbi:MAG: hypothetical protein KatS3mg108_2293 [Isosphaeraceae bacterium]|jgi:hypothetical protein|nr:MAG: hypothetical protein KatS3mg108_2293 [Isosphaeraceae bacterium]
MARRKGRLIQSPSIFIDNVSYDLEEDLHGKVTSGSFEVVVGVELQPGQYRVELEDGRSGLVSVTGYNPVSTQGRFEVIEGF